MGRPPIHPLIAKNPEIQRRLASGRQLSEQEEKDAYKNIVRSIPPLVGDAGVSIEVFSDLGSRAEEMLAQGQEMFTWIPHAYVKYPCSRGFSIRRNVGAKKYSGQQDSVFFAEASRCRICSNTGIEGASVCITVRRDGLEVGSVAPWLSGGPMSPVAAVVLSHGKLCSAWRRPTRLAHMQIVDLAK